MAFDDGLHVIHALFMKTGLIADLYRKLGEGLGLLEPSSRDAETTGRTEAQIREGLIALEGLRQWQLQMRKDGVTRKEVTRWIREDRRI